MKKINKIRRKKMEKEDRNPPKKIEELLSQNHHQNSFRCKLFKDEVVSKS
jgi:hypothetical protein